MTDILPITDTGQEDQQQHELLVEGTGSLANALIALMQGRDKLLADAINFKIGGVGWSLTDIIKRGKFISQPGKIETFIFDGVPLVEFWPHQTTMLAYGLTITQKYRRLYSNKGVH